MKCVNCSKEIEDSSNYCKVCGYKTGESTILYHYTSTDALLAILNGVKKDTDESPKFCLWATRWDFLNDSRECRYLCNVLFQPDKDGNEESKVKKFRNLLHEGPGLPYILSFSKSKDNLDMWRSYACNGSGVAIGIDAKEIKKFVTEKLNNSDHWNLVRFFDCRYLEEGLLSEFTSKVFSSDNNHNISESFPCYKHPCYMNEQEKRIVLFDYKLDPSQIKFRINGETLIPYKEVFLPVSIIKEIQIGPCANSELQKENIELLMQSNALLRNMVICITQSKVPYQII